MIGPKRIPSTMQEADLMDEVADLTAKLRHAEIMIKSHEDYIIRLTDQLNAQTEEARKREHRYMEAERETNHTIRKLRDALATKKFQEKYVEGE